MEDLALSNDPETHTTGKLAALLTPRKRSLDTDGQFRYVIWDYSGCNPSITTFVTCRRCPSHAHRALFVDTPCTYSQVPGVLSAQSFQANNWLNI
jgi:hypothetical protein